MTEQRQTRLDNVRRSAAVAVVAVLVMGTAAGCSEASPAPEPLEESTSPASTAPSPTAEPSGPPTLPPEARGTSKQAAVAFVEHWISIFNYSTATLSTEPLRRASAETCVACAAMLESIRDVSSQGGHFQGAGWQATSLQVLPNGESARPQVRAEITFSPRKVFESDGAEPIEFQGGKTVYTFNLALDPQGKWLVADIIGVAQ